jgi:putative addiction module CopG family antidote
MNVSLKPAVQKLIDERVNSGQYSSPEEVVEAAVLALDQIENFGEFEAGELDHLLAEGEQSINRDGTLDGDDAYHRRAERRAQRRSSSQ